MIWEVAVIFILMALDFPFTVAPATVWGLSLGLDVVYLGLLYVISTICSALVCYFALRKQAKRFKTWKIIGRYKAKGAFYSVFVANMLAHIFDTAAASGYYKLNLFTTMLALTASNIIYFIILLAMVALLMLLSNVLAIQIIVSMIVVAFAWTVTAHSIMYKLGFGW